MEGVIDFLLKRCASRGLHTCERPLNVRVNCSNNRTRYGTEESGGGGLVIYDWSPKSQETENDK